MSFDLGGGGGGGLGVADLTGADPENEQRAWKTTFGGVDRYARDMDREQERLRELQRAQAEEREERQRAADKQQARHSGCLWYWAPSVGQSVKWLLGRRVVGAVFGPPPEPAPLPTYREEGDSAPPPRPAPRLPDGGAAPGGAPGESAEERATRLLAAAREGTAWSGAWPPAAARVRRGGVVGLAVEVHRGGYNPLAPAPLRERGVVSAAEGDWELPGDHPEGPRLIVLFQDPHHPDDPKKRYTLSLEPRDVVPQVLAEGWDKEQAVEKEVIWFSGGIEGGGPGTRATMPWAPRELIGAAHIALDPQK